MKKETTLVAALLCAAVSFGELSTLTPKVLKASWADAWWRKKRVGAYARLFSPFAGIDFAMRLECLAEGGDRAESAALEDAFNGQAGREEALGLLQPEPAPFLVDGSAHDFAIADFKQPARNVE